MGEEGSTTSSFNTRPVHAVRDDLCQLSQASRIFISRNITPEIGACNARRTVRVPSVLSDIEATFLSFRAQLVLIRSNVQHTLCRADLGLSHVEAVRRAVVTGGK